MRRGLAVEAIAAIDEIQQTLRCGDACPRHQSATNGLRPDQIGKEGTDMFRQEERYFRAYASYFSRFVDEYHKQGIDVSMVMPQNEFNSAAAT